MILRKENTKMNEVNRKIIYTTDNYYQFKKLMNNRDVRSGGVKNIIDSINTIGYVTNPIIVNEKHEVIDGQHRLEALKALGMKVDYIVAEGAGIEECRLMNRKQGNWTTMDYLKSYARGGNENYIRLYDLMLRHPQQKLSVIMFAIKRAMHSQTEVVEGVFTCGINEFKNADRRLLFLDEIIDILRKMDGRTDFLAMAILYAYENESVDTYRLTDTIVKRWNMIRPSVSLSDALENLSEAYNFKARHKIYLKTDWLRENEKRAKKTECSKKSGRIRKVVGNQIGELKEKEKFYE